MLPQPIVIADYGAAGGNDSLKPLSRAIDVLRRRTRHDHPILVAHTDSPENDFTALFKTLADDDDSYLSTDTAHQGLILHSVYHRPNGWDHIAEQTLAVYTGLTG